MANQIEIAQKTVSAILKEREIETDFFSLTNGFEEKLKSFAPLDNAFDLNQYFRPGNGVKSVLKALAGEFPYVNEAAGKGKSDGKLSDFMGLYVLIHGNRPFYVGISRGVINRLNQHLKGLGHNSASLAYKIAKKNDKSEANNGTKKKFRNELEQERIKAAQHFLLQQRAAILPISNHEELYLFEVFVSMKYKTLLNTFETH
jgi:hypothetical protein